MGAGYGSKLKTRDRSPPSRGTSPPPELTFKESFPFDFSWTTKNWHGLQMQRLSVVLHTAVAWQTVNELACGESGIVHGAECIAVLNGVA